MNHEWEIGDTGYLKEPFLGYRYFEVVDFECGTGRIIIELSSGRQITVNSDEIEEL